MLYRAITTKDLRSPPPLKQPETTQQNKVAHFNLRHVFKATVAYLCLCVMLLQAIHLYQVQLEALIPVAVHPVH